MEWHEIEVNGRRTVKFPEKVLHGQQMHKPAPIPDADTMCFGNKIGGIIRRGEWAWLAKGCTLQIVSLRNGQTMSTFEFTESKGYDSCCIKCVEEIFPGNSESVLLAICLESFRGRDGGGSFIALYSVEHSNVLSCMELMLHVTCARFMSSNICRRSLLQNFDGCLAVGTEEGIVVLLDLKMQKLLTLYDEEPINNKHIPCHIIDYSMPLTEIHRNFRKCQKDGVHIGLQVEVIDAPTAIQCLLPIDLILGLAIGLEDGRLAFYDLAELQIFYIALPMHPDEMTSLVKMDFIEPPDDPRPCLYVWAMHENEQHLTAVLHTLMYEKRFTEEDNFSYFESFQTSSIRLKLPLEATRSTAIGCQAISKIATHADDDSHCLCALSWHSEMDEKNKFLIFDLNQWYKEEMPCVLNWEKQPSYLAAYILNGQDAALHVYIDPTTIAHFNSMQRFEEHFYPNSLSFDCLLLLSSGCRFYNWEGAQNRVINILRCSNASIFLEPEPYFQQILRQRLLPQFSELNVNSTFSRNAKYETILSVALENNCYSILRDCAKCWADGSFMGNFTATTGISLSTLTEWIWKRATDIKTRCNDLCKGLFDFGAYPLDLREQKELGVITRQLKLLADLLGEILLYSKRHIPDKVFTNLDSRHKSLRIATDYQSVLLWLVNIGLLPEAVPYSSSSSKINTHTELVPYPYRQLRDIYAEKRAFFAKMSESFILKKTGSCRLIYIDSFIEHVCKSSILHEYWLENKGDGLYPPTTIEAMLRVMLVPEVDYDSKCAILLYYFLDLHMAIDERLYKKVVANFIKFPSVFKLPAALIKTVQAFWNLDHGHFLPAVDEFISPFNNNQNYPQWLLELLTEALLTQNAANLALRIMEARPTLVSPVLKLKTLLANELISEAFHFARSKYDDSLLELFFSCCLCAGKFGIIRDLALSEKEGQLVQDILKRSKVNGAESLHFVYLLQKSKYIEAVSYMDELSKAKSLRSNYANANIDTPNLVLSAFNTTMTPVTQGLTDVYFRIRNKIKKKEADNKSPVPLSCQLIKQNANNLLGGIYHSSALSAHFATHYWGEMSDKNKSSVLSCNNAPFLRKPQIDTHYLDYFDKNTISYPQTYKVREKRTLAEIELHNNSADDVDARQVVQQNPKKRRRLGEEVIKDLSHFMQMNKNSSRLNVSEFSFKTAEDHHKAKLDMTPVESIMIQPAKTQFNPEESYDKRATKSQATVELHGILKTNTPEPTERLSLRKEMPVEEEKNIRFMLPSKELANSTSDEEIPVKTCNEQAEQGKAVAEFIEEKFLGTPKKNDAITRSISVDSDDSMESSKSLSEENFYSPLSSKNVSMVCDSGRASNILDTASSQKDISNHSFLSGPQPRKPLARLSAERSEKSITPEPSAHRAEKQLDADVAFQGSSGFGSIDAKSSTTTSAFSNKTPAFTISSVKSLASSEFSPRAFSSKVCETQSRFSFEKTQSHVKSSERSTVVGSLTDFESTEETYKNLPAVGSEDTYTTCKDSQNETKMLDTTLGMSSYEMTVLDATTLHETKSICQPDISSKEREKSGDREKVEADLYAQALGLAEQSTSQDMAVNDDEFDLYEEIEVVTEQQHVVAKVSDDVIVLSTSSSSSEDFYNDSEVSVDVDKSESELNESEDEAEEQDADEEEEDVEDDIEDLLDSEDGEISNESLDEENENAFNDEEDDEDSVEILDDSSEDEVNKERFAQAEQSTNLSNESDDVRAEANSLEAVVNQTLANPSQESISVEDHTVSDQQEQHAIIENLEQKVVTTTNAENDDEKETEEHEVTVEETIEPEAVQSNEEARQTVINEKYVKLTVEDASKSIEHSKASLEIVEEKTNTKPELDMDYSVSEPIIESVADTRFATKPDKLSTEIDEIPTSTESQEVGANEIVIQETESANMEVSQQEEEIILHVDEEDYGESAEPKTSVKNKNLGDVETTAAVVEERSSEIESEKEKSPNSELIAGDIANISDGDKKANNEEIIAAVDERVTQLESNQQSIEITDNIKSPPKEQENVIISTPKKRKAFRGTSVPRGEFDINEASVSTPAKRGTRGISVPPQTLLENEDSIVVTPHGRRTRGTSVPPQITLENADAAVITPRSNRNSLRSKVLLNEDADNSGSPRTPRTRRNIRGTSEPIEEATTSYESPRNRTGRGTSLPPEAGPAKTNTRRKSALLDAIAENSVIVDSPSTRTRARARLNSMDSELDSSIVSSENKLQKHTHKTSISSSVSEQPQTPKRTRRTSVTSQSDAGTPRTRARKRKGSVDEQSDSTMTENKNTEKDNESDVEENKKKKSSPKFDASTASTYSSSRRLTRTQLAIMEKSAALADASTKERTKISPTAPKRISKRRTSRSTNTTNQDSDDAESISSHVSNFSSPAVKRRVTRSSVKDKDEMDDDLASVASSVNSDRQTKRRSKDKSSPNTTLSTIPEVESDEHVGPKKRGRPAKH